jgi:hypothetical protein
LGLHSEYNSVICNYIEKYVLFGAIFKRGFYETGNAHLSQFWSPVFLHKMTKAGKKKKKKEDNFAVKNS